MPEGDTVRAVGNLWERQIGQPFEVTSPSGRAAHMGQVDGHDLAAVETKGKHLFLGFENDRWIHVHLGRFGKFHWHHDDEPQPPAANVRLRMVTADFWVDLVGPIACELVDPPMKEIIEDKLGPDPLHPEDDGHEAFAKIIATHRPIGALLMDQTIIAGIGNIYRAELLWRSRISPYRPGDQIDRETFDTLWADTRLLLTQGVKQHVEGTPTHTIGLPLPDGSNPVPQVFGRRNHTQVYQRTGLPCSRCGTNIVQEEMAGRTLFYCPMCQQV